MVARADVLDEVTGAQHVVHVRRAAAARSLAQDAQAVAEAVVRVAGQGELTAQPVPQMDVEVRAGLPGRQLAPLRVDELDGEHAVGLQGQAAHEQALGHRRLQT